MTSISKQNKTKKKKKKTILNYKVELGEKQIENTPHFIFKIIKLHKLLKNYKFPDLIVYDNNYLILTCNIHFLKLIRFWTTQN